MLVLFAVVAQISVSVGHVHAQSGEVFRGRDGNYEIVVNMQPVEPVVGEAHFSILPINTQTNEPIQNARVTLFTRDESGDDLYKALALNTPRFPNFYESNFKFKSEGTWNISVELESGQLGQASFSFPLEVGPQALPPENTEATIFFFFLVAVMLGGIFYVWRSIKRQRRIRVA
jgi:hypothetical protein